jgi:hypothetical protein
MRGKIIIIGIVICLLTLSFSGCTEEGDSKKYTLTEEFTDKGCLDTDSFTITGEKWKVKWNMTKTEGETLRFSCNVYPAGTDDNLVANLAGSKGEMVIDTGKDDFYFKIHMCTGIESWTIKVYDYE